MPARGAGGGGAINPNRIKQAAKKPAPPARNLPDKNVVTFKPAQVATPEKRLTKTFSAISKASHEKAAKQHERTLGRKTFGQSLASATKENYETGGHLRQYAAEHPAPVKRGVLGTIIYGLGKGEHAVEGGVQDALKFLHATPGGYMNTAAMNPSEREAQRAAGAKVITQAAELGAPFGAAKALRGAAGALEAARGAKAAAQAEHATTEALKEIAGTAVKGSTAKQLEELRQVHLTTGAARSTGVSRALKVGAGASAGYGKMLVGADVAKAAIEAGGPGKASLASKKEESWPERIYHSVINTIANIPAATVEAPFHPAKTLKGLAEVYTDPKHAFEENPFGAVLSWLLPATAADRVAGGFVRGASKGHYLSRERPSLAYDTGTATSREYQAGALASTPGRIKTALLEKPRQAASKAEEHAYTQEGVPRPVQATKRQEIKNVVGGHVRPGQVDMIEQGQKLAHVLEQARGHDFLVKHLINTTKETGKDAAHNDLLMAFHEGVARTTKTAWRDIEERLARLKEAQVTHKDKALNDKTVQRLENVLAHRSDITDKELHQAEKSAAEIAPDQRRMYELLHQEGVGEADQLNARNIPMILSHPELFGRGKLAFNKEPGPHPTVVKLKAAQAELEAARRDYRKQATEVVASRPKKGVKSGMQYSLDRARERVQVAAQHENELAHEVNSAKYSGAIKHNGDQFPGVYDEAGKRISQRDVQKVLNEHFNGREMGFVTQAQDKVLARTSNLYGPRTQYPMRTGTNFLNGAYDNSAAALRNHYDRAAYNLAEMRGSRAVAEGLIHGKLEGGWFNSKEDAEAFADSKNYAPEGKVLEPHLGEWQAVPVGAQKVADIIDAHPFGEHLEQLGSVEHAATQEEGGVWGVAPERIGNRLDKWQKVEEQVRNSALRQLTTPWRQTGLYTSTRWPFGTTQENAIRLAFHRVSPLVVGPGIKGSSLSFKTGADISRFLEDKINDPSVGPAQKQAAAFHRAMYGSGNFVGAQLHELMPSLEKMTEQHPWIRKLSESHFNETRIGPNHVVGWRPYRKFVGNALAKMETNAKVAAGGKLALDDAGFFSKWKKIDREQAAHDYVEKVTSDPVRSIEEARKLMDIMGNWNHLTPLTRQAQAEWAPFALWWLNSAKFVFKTMPKDHPYATGLLAALVTATGAENKDLKNYLAGEVPLTLPILGKVDFNPVHYSPFDIAHEPEKTAGSMLVPQLLGPATTAKGLDSFTGNKIEADKVVPRLIRGGIEEYVPGARPLAGVLGKGGKPTASQVFPWETAPGTDLGYGKAAFKTFFPLKLKIPRKEASGIGKETGGSGRSSWNGGGSSGSGGGSWK